MFLEIKQIYKSFGQAVVFHPPVDTPTVIPEVKEETVYIQADAAVRPTRKP